MLEGFAFGTYVFYGLDIAAGRDYGYGLAIVDDMLQFIFSQHGAGGDGDGPDFLSAEKRNHVFRLVGGPDEIRITFGYAESMHGIGKTIGHIF